MCVNVGWQSVAVMHSMEILSAVWALSAQEEPPATSSPPSTTPLPPRTLQVPVRMHSLQLHLQREALSGFPPSVGPPCVTNVGLN